MKVPWIVALLSGCAGDTEVPRDVAAGDQTADVASRRFASAQATTRGLGDTRRDSRPVNAAFWEVMKAWGYRLCYEDAALAAPWAANRELGPDGVVADALRVLSLHEIENGPPQQVAAAVLATALEQDGLLKFELKDVAGCVTATPVSRRKADDSWEPVVPVLDRSIEVSPALTYKEALVEFERAMDDTGIQLRVSGGAPGDAQCEVPIEGGSRIAREVLGDILTCSPWGDRSVFVLLTVDGVNMTLNMPGGGVKAL